MMDDDALVRHISGLILSGSSQEEPLRILKQRGYDELAATALIHKAEANNASEDHNLFKGSVLAVAGIATSVGGSVIVLGMIYLAATANSTYRFNLRTFSFGVGAVVMSCTWLVRYYRSKQDAE